MESDVVSAEYIPASARCSWSLFKMSQQICRHTIYYHTNSTLYMYLNLLGNSLKMLLCCCIFHFLYGIAVCCKKNWPHQWTLILITSSILKQSLSLLWFLFSIQRSTIHPSFPFPFLPLFIAVNMAIKSEFDGIIAMNKSLRQLGGEEEKKCSDIETRLDTVMMNQPFCTILRALVGESRDDFVFTSIKT